MEAVAWAVFGLLVATVGILAAAVLQIPGRFDQVNARIDALSASLNARIDALAETLRRHLDRHGDGA